MSLFGLGLFLVLAGGVAGWMFRRRPAASERLFTWGMAAGATLALLPALAALGIPPRPGAWLAAVAMDGPLAFGIDALSAWFLLLVLGVGALAAVYGAAYLAPERGRRPVARAHLLLAVLVVALAGVVTARTIVAFLASWEIMAICAYLLVLFEQERVEARRAGAVYIVLTHTCTLALIAMFAVWTGGRVDASFAELGRAAAATPPATNLILTLAIIGFGIKAGVVPFHFWLPDAHSAAPTHVSAIMSGIMIKTGVYGVARVLALSGAPPAWWGWTLLLLGLASAVLGVLWALTQHDLKRLLAYHSVENVGIIFMGLGLGALGAAYHNGAIAALGYAGALLHTLNHGLFKSLLFLGAGVAARAAGTREIDRLGGLARSVPRTALAFLVGSAAIVGLPPLNGFVSEWLVFRGLVASGGAEGGLRLACVAVVGLALTGALALACFSKLYGVAFLGRPRHDAGPAAAPEPRGLSVPQLVLAAACVLIGVAPPLAMPALMRAAARMAPGLVGATEVRLASQGALAISLLALALAAAIALIASARWLALRGRPRGAAPTWGCAFDAPTGRMQYTASSFAAPLLGVFGAASGSRVERTPASFRTHPHDLALDRLARPAWKRITDTAADMRILQSGGLRWYLLYTIVCLLALLSYLRYMAAR